MAKYRKHNTKYNVGDVVVIRKDLVVGEDYGRNLTFVDEMELYIGKKVTITHVDYEGDYHVENNTMWYFNDEMIEGYEDSYFFDKILFDKSLPFENNEDVSEHGACNLGSLQKYEYKEVSLNDTATVRLESIKVIHNDPATILFYYDLNGEVKKSVAKVNKEEGDVYDPIKGLEVATIKAMMKELNRSLKKY